MSEKTEAKIEQIMECNYDKSQLCKGPCSVWLPAAGLTFVGINNTIMLTQRIHVDHLKCGGCANTIRKAVLEFEGVKKVEVDPERQMVDILSEAEVNLAGIKKRLRSLGYPEAGTSEGLEKFGSHVKSYISCAIGRLSGEAQEEKPSL